MRQLGDYTLTRRLGVGGMGEVWMGRREALGGAARDVAIKLLSPERADSADAREGFLAEARLSMLLRNSNIVQVYDVAETDDKTCYMVMEFVEGLDLAALGERLREAGEVLPDTIIAYIIGEVLKGLAHAHELDHEGQRKTVVHRDVSPHNVMLSVFGEVKLMDFGIARIASEDTSGTFVKGKLRYMPPEQLRSETREPTLDLFAVGAMLHELLDGQKFRGKVTDENRLIGMCFAGEIPPMSRPRESIPEQLEQLRASLLEPEAKDRIQTAREAFRALTSWPGYRDTRFELDELVRRFVGSERSPAPSASPSTASTEPAATPGAAGSQLAPTQRFVVSSPLTAAPVDAAGSRSDALAIASSSAEGTVTALLLAEGSDTSLARVRAPDSAGSRSVAVEPDPRRRLARYRVGLGLFGLVAIGVGAGATLGGESGEGDELARAEAPAKRGGEAPPSIAPELPTEPPSPEPDAPRPAVEPAAPRPAPVAEPPVAEPPVEREPEPPPEISKTRVSIQLGSGVAWAEVKLGGRTHELDAFSGKAGASRLAPGSYRVECRTKVDGPWTDGGKLEIPEGRARVVVAKNCELSIK